MRFLRIAASVFVLVLLAGFALAFAVYSSYSDLAELNRKAKAEFASWEAALAPRRELLDELAEITAEYDPSAGEAVEQADSQVESKIDDSEVEERIALHLGRAKALKDLRAHALQFPQLRDSDLFREWEAGYLKSQIAEEHLRGTYNDAAREYNAVLESVSGQVIALLFTVPPKPLIPG